MDEKPEMKNVETADNAPKAQGLSKEQLEEQLDQFNAQKVQLEQEQVLLEFDLENYGETLRRKVRMNRRTIERVNSNIKVVENQIDELPKEPRK